MKEQISLLKQERLKRNWSRAKVEALTERRIPVSSLERWEERKSWPRGDNIEVLCKLYGKSAKELGLDKSGDIMTVESINAPTSQERTSMSDLIRRSALSDLGSYLTGLVSTWPRRNHHYGELQEGINRAILDHSTLIEQDVISVMNRRQALKSLGLIPIQLIGGVALTSPRKTADTDTLLPYCAAGITACWYLRRGKELAFVSDLVSTYISILQPLVYSKSEVHQKAAAGLLAQTFRLKGHLNLDLESNEQAIFYHNEAIRYALIANDITEQALANRMMAFVHWHTGPQGYEQALFYAETAYGLIRKDTPKLIRSFTASGLSLFQAANGKMEDVKISLKEAHDCFDVVAPVPSFPYTESNILAISAHVRRFSNQWQESTNLWAKSLATPDITALGSIQARINYAKTEVSRDDKPRDMALCIKLLTEAITGATELDSKRYKREAHECYNLLRIAWPREDAVKTLGKDHFGLK